MSRKRKGFNWKARQVTDVEIDDKTEEKVCLFLTSADTQFDSTYELLIWFSFQIHVEFTECKYDDSNALVLPSKKRKTVLKKHNAPDVKVLSKKQRKFFEKILEKKKKKERVTLIYKDLCFPFSIANV